jgi:hypothetical protein
VEGWLVVGWLVVAAELDGADTLDGTLDRDGPSSAPWSAKLMPAKARPAAMVALITAIRRP